MISAHVGFEEMQKILSTDLKREKPKEKAED
jgi:hypothetical protein